MKTFLAIVILPSLATLVTSAQSHLNPSISNTHFQLVRRARLVGRGDDCDADGFVKVNQDTRNQSSHNKSKSTDEGDESVESSKKSSNSSNSSKKSKSSSSSPSQKSSSSSDEDGSSSQQESSGSSSNQSSSPSGGTSGTATFYNQDGTQGACGLPTVQDSALVVAFAPNLFQSCCGKQVTITSKSTGKTTSCKCNDECTGCDDSHIDLSIGCWDALGVPQSVGVTDVTFSVDD